MRTTDVGCASLDPYGLQLQWATVQAIGEMRSVEVFLNFPIMDMNRNALLRNPTKIVATQAQRMTDFWGDESWRSLFYQTAPQLDLWGQQHDAKAVDNQRVADAYRNRLRDVAGFTFVPPPLAMRNSSNAILYYLFFASHKAVASGIVEQIFDKYRRRG
jgi:three-Cys-motif partner protein